MYQLTLITLLAAASAAAVQNVERASGCTSGNLWQGEYCCPGTFIYQQDTMDEPICCVGDSADGYYFNSGPSSCTAGTSTPITAFDKSGNAVSGGASATDSSRMASSTTLASVTARTTSSAPLSSASAGSSGNVGSSSSASVAFTSSISSAVSASQATNSASTSTSDGAGSMITGRPLGFAIGALGALAIL